MAWGVAEFSAWSAWARSAWSSSMDQAWASARDGYQATIEATTPDILRRKAQEAYDALWGPDGAYAILRGYSDAYAALDEFDRIDLQARAAQAAGIAGADAAPEAIQRRLDVLGAGMLKDARWQDGGAPVIGVAPIVIAGGIILSLGGLCWMWIKKSEIDVERSRLELIGRFGASDPGAALAALHPPPASSSMMPLLLGGLAVVGVVGVATVLVRR